MLATDGLRQLKMPVLFLMKTLHSKMGQPMLVNWFYGGGLRESPFYGSRGTDFVIPLPVSEGIPGVQLVGIKQAVSITYCNYLFIYTLFRFGTENVHLALFFVRPSQVNRNIMPYFS